MVILVTLFLSAQGSKEGLASWVQNSSIPDPDFLAAKSFEYGFTRIKVFNSSHLHMEQVSIDQVYKVRHNFWHSITMQH